VLISLISRASSRCASRRVPRTACHLRCCFPPASRPSRSPRPRRTFPAYDMALHRFIALGKVCIWFAGTDKHLCNLGVCRENGLHNRCFRAFPALTPPHSSYPTRIGAKPFLRSAEPRIDNKPRWTFLAFAMQCPARDG